jgi:hypothetical protein
MMQEAPVQFERKLTAILAADAVGYSRLMYNHEEDTHAKLSALLKDAVYPAVVGGRLLGGVSERGGGSSCRGAFSGPYP